MDVDESPSLCTVIDRLLRQNELQKLEQLLVLLEGLNGAFPKTYVEDLRRQFGISDADLRSLKQSKSTKIPTLVKWLKASLASQQGKWEQAVALISDLDGSFTDDDFLGYVVQYHLLLSAYRIYSSSSQHGRLGDVLRQADELFAKIEKKTFGPESLLLQLSLLHLIIAIRLHLFLATHHATFDPKQTLIVAIGKAIGFNKLISLTQSVHSQSSGHRRPSSELMPLSVPTTAIIEALTIQPSPDDGLFFRSSLFRDCVRLISSMEDILQISEPTIDGQYRAMGWDLLNVLQTEIGLIQLFAFHLSLGASSSLLPQLHSTVINHVSTQNLKGHRIEGLDELPDFISFLVEKSKSLGDASLHNDATFTSNSSSSNSFITNSLLFVQAQGLLARQNFEAAHTLFSKLVSVNFRLAQCHNMLGIIEMRLNKPWLSLARFKDAMRADSSFLAPLYNITRVYHDQHKYADEQKLLDMLEPHVEEQEAQRTNTRADFESFLSSSDHLAEVQLGRQYSNSQDESKKWYLCTQLVQWRRAQNRVCSRQYELALGELQQLLNSLTSKKTGGFLSICMIKHEMARVYLSLERNDELRALLGVPSDTNPDVVGISLLAESYLRSKNSKQALHWMKYLVALLEEARNQEIGLVMDFVDALEVAPAAKRSKTSQRRPKLVFRGKTITQTSETALLFEAAKRTRFEFDVLINTGALHQCRQEYDDAMECYAKAKQVAKNMKLASGAATPGWAESRMLIACYNASLLAFKLQKLDFACNEWVKYRFGEEMATITTATLTKHKKAVMGKVKATCSSAMRHEDFVFLDGTITPWQLDQFDKHLLEVAIRLKNTLRSANATAQQQ